jgi:hypothetical protein
MTPETIITEIAGTIPIAGVLWLWLNQERRDASFWREKYIRLVERIIEMDGSQDDGQGD